MEDGCIDLTLTSPPYDDLRNYKGYSFEFEKIAKELFRVTKESGVVVWIVGDSTLNGSESGTSFNQALYFKSIGFNLHDTMIYHKDNPPPVGGENRYYQSFEYMFVFSKGTPTLYPIKCKRRNKWNDKRKERVRGVLRSKDGDFTKSLVKIQNVWSYVVSGGTSSKDKIAYEHPAIFPEKLAEDHIVSWTKEGEIVYDPFMGSGTTAKMSFLNNRRYIGSEISETYHNISERRVKHYTDKKFIF